MNYKSTTNANAVVTEQEMNQLEKRTAAKHIKALPEEITKAQDALVQCYNKNQQRSLDCWAEVQEFKDVVQKAQNVMVFSFVHMDPISRYQKKDMVTLTMTLVLWFRHSSQLLERQRRGYRQSVRRKKRRWLGIHRLLEKVRITSVS